VPAGGRGTSLGNPATGETVSGANVRDDVIEAGCEPAVASLVSPGRTTRRARMRHRGFDAVL